MAGLAGVRATRRDSGTPTALSDEDRRRIQALKAADARVRAHESAHQGAAGGIATGGATFTYVRGPDGQAYAVGGEVTIDAGPVPGNPRATLAKAQQIQRAALAPADPSPQDQAVAAAAQAMAAQASAELLHEGVRPSGVGLRVDVMA